ncbi:hypothetical protein [Scytonema hofmannii]|uniref:hypothetical protein n=1 Tax=Scytonema hofmannii TaxID=34078 RepID=UPI00191C7262
MFSQRIFSTSVELYCHDLRPIRQHLKKDELSGQMFDDELDLAYAVINGIDARGQRGDYTTERVKFYSNYSP